MIMIIILTLLLLHCHCYRHLTKNNKARVLIQSLPEPEEDCQPFINRRQEDTFTQLRIYNNNEVTTKKMIKCITYEFEEVVVHSVIISAIRKNLSSTI